MKNKFKGIEQTRKLFIVYRRYVFIYFNIEHFYPFEGKVPTLCGIDGIAEDEGATS